MFIDLPAPLPHEPENEAQVFEYLTSEQHRRAEDLFHQIKARLVQRHSPDERIGNEKND